MTDRHILDNQTRTVASYLRQALGGADDFRFVSAYFTIYGYDLLAQQFYGLRDQEIVTVQRLSPSLGEQAP